MMIVSFFFKYNNKILFYYARLSCLLIIHNYIESFIYERKVY